MLDEFSSYDPVDYLAGFPAHPHRGFETVTYMLDGRMRHEDHLGQPGRPGSGRRAVDDGGARDHPFRDAAADRRADARLPAVDQPAGARQDETRRVPGRAGREIPTVALDSGGQVRVILGELVHAGAHTRGPVKAGSVASLYLDVQLPAGARFDAPVPDADNVFLYLFEGDAAVGPDAQALPGNAAGLLGPGDRVAIQAGAHGARFLLIAGRPIGEPVVQYGPFVMNTRAEIDQAIADYQSGRLATA